MRPLIVIAICLSMVLYAGVSLSESDEICCTWVNTENDATKTPHKIMFHYDGTYAAYANKASSQSPIRGMFQIVKKWSDAEGSVWYQIMMHDPKKDKEYKLAKITENGKKLEFVNKSDKYPTEVKPDKAGYCKFLRASMDYKSLP